MISKYDRSPVMIAANAFGTGIDKSNVSCVIHFNTPKSLETYYQEAARYGEAFLRKINAYQKGGDGAI